MVKVKLHLNSTLFNATKSSIKAEAKRLNAYLDQLLARVPDLKLSRENVLSFVVGAKIDSEQINDLVFQTLLNKNTQIANLNLSREKAALILDIPDLSDLDQYLQVNTLISNTQYWKLKNNQVELNSGWLADLEEACTIFADAPLELERLKIANEILELTLKFYNTIEPEKQPDFDFEASLLVGNAEQLVIDYEKILNGTPFKRIHRWVLDYSDQTTKRGKKDDYQTALRKAYKNLQS